MRACHNILFSGCKGTHYYLNTQLLHVKFNTSEHYLGFSKGNRWKPPNKLTETASKDDGNRQRRQRFAVLPMLMNISG